jgi:selenocysteine lyase/cysteine desulfurase
LGGAALYTPFLGFPYENKSKATQEPYPNEVDAFWERVRQDYDLKPAYVNLENGYYNFIPKPTLQKYLEHIKMVNYEASYYMRTVQWENKDKVRDRLAHLVGASPEELVITRNTTESLDMIIGGYPWKKGDEAIFALQDYGAMKDHFELISLKYGVKNKIISLPNHPISDEQIVSLYESQITKRTRLIMVCHMVNITGQILPVRKICDMAHKHRVEVMVDGAHCIGHFEVNISNLNCDYYGSSLHKWLSVPLGSGMLYVAKAHIPKIWPLFADSTNEIPKIKRLNHTGTLPVHTDLAISDAIDYLEIIGLERKQERLRYLQRYWSDALRNEANIVVNTPIEPERSCGIANVGIRHIKPADLAKRLLDEFQIFTVAIDYANVQGCRITPNVYTTTNELDLFINAMKTLAART